MSAAVTSRSSAGVDVICRGTPWEMGFAQGSAFRVKVAQAREDLLRRLEAFRLQQPSWMPFWLYRLLAEYKGSRFLAEPLAHDFPDMSQRLKGLAKGSGAGLRAIHLFNALEPMLSAVGGCTACPSACSAVAVRGRRSATGDPIIARNFDYLPLVQPYYLLRESRPEGRLGALEFTTVPLAGAVDGINERGLCITYDYAFTLDEPRKGAAPISMQVAGALECCSTVAEAAAWIISRRRWGGGLLMMADADGDIASLELSSTRSHLRRPEAGEDVLFHSNAFFSTSMKDIEAPQISVFTGRAPTPLRGQRLHESSYQRDRRFQHLLAQAGPLGADDLAAIMADHGPEGSPS
jgi:hypothetical protein